MDIILDIFVLYGTCEKCFNNKLWTSLNRLEKVWNFRMFAFYLAVLTSLHISTLWFCLRELRFYLYLTQPEVVDSWAELGMLFIQKQNIIRVSTNRNNT